MGYFRPTRKVSDPDGRIWEIYVSPLKGSRLGSLVRLVLTLRWTPVRDVRSTQMRIEAISFKPWYESHLWLATEDHVERVVAQVAAGLETGQVARPLGADFRGSRERVGNSTRGVNREG